MLLIEKIKSDSLIARKNKLKESALLVTLFAESAKIGKDSGNRDTTDSEVISVIKKFIEGARETIRLGGNREELEFEISILEKYLPEQLSYDELFAIISKIVEEKSPKNMGVVMGILKTEYANLYDGAIASKIVKELL